MTTFLLDMSNLMYSTVLDHHQKTGDQIDPDLMRGIFISRLKTIRASLKMKPDDDMVLAFDSSTYWRRDIFPHYKAQRKATRDKSKLDWDLFFKSYQQIKGEFFPVSRWKCLEVDGAEADDTIAVLALRLCQSTDVVIVSGDGDFLQLQGKGRAIRQWSIVKKGYMSAKDYDLFEHIVRGDTGDGIPNILSDDDTFMCENKRQKSVYAKSVDEWRLAPGPDHFCVDTEMLRRYETNRRLIDLSCIPEDLQAKIVQEYERVVPAVGKMNSWVIQHRMMRLLPI